MRIPMGVGSLAYDRELSGPAPRPPRTPYGYRRGSSVSVGHTSVGVGQLDRYYHPTGAHTARRGPRG